MTSNSKTDDNGSEGPDWRADAADALERDGSPETANRRGRGRPKGSSNRKTQDFATWYDQQGYKDPLQLQAEFMSADPVGIQAFFIEHERTQKAIGKAYGKAVPSLGEIVKEQMACARDIAPYLHGKAPVRLEIVDERLPILVINAGTNQLDQARTVASQRGLSVGRPMVELNSNKINDLVGQGDTSPTAESPTKGKAQ